MRHLTGEMGKLLFALLLMNVLLIAAGYVPHNKSHLKLQKLCSKSLSDALYVVCRESGYNEPFSYSGEDEPRVDTGPGLVDECCYHSCTYEQLEQYCKPTPEKKQPDSSDVISGSNVPNLSYSTSTRDLSSEQSPPSEMDHIGGTIKRKVDDLKRGWRRGKGGRNDDDECRGKGGRNNDGECRGKADAKKRRRGRHSRHRRRRLEYLRASKIFHGNTKSTVLPSTKTTTLFRSTS